MKGRRISIKDRRTSLKGEKILRNTADRKLSGLSQKSFHLRRASRAVTENESDDRMLRSEMELNSIKTTVIAIENLWRDVSMGIDQISTSTLSCIHKELGEIGSELFSRIFLNKSKSAQVAVFALSFSNLKSYFIIFQLSEREYWCCWINFFAEELFFEDEMGLESEQAPLLETGLELKESFSSTIEVEVDDDPVNCFEFIHSRIAPSRHLNNLFFQEDIMVTFLVNKKDLLSIEVTSQYFFPAGKI